MIYTENGYDKLIRKSYGYSQEEQDSSSEWALLRELYDRNYIHGNHTEDNIPKKIHQIWLGGELPDKFKPYCDTWKILHPTWEYKLWTDKDVDSINIEKRDIFNLATNLGQKSDILRYEILRQQGGVYVDTDFECIKPIDDFLFLNFFTGISTDPDAQLYIGILGSASNHPTIVKCIEGLHTAYSGNDGNKIMDATGPFYFTRCFFASNNRDSDGVVAFPMDFFYPFPNSQRFTKTAYDYITSCTYAIHHWKTSWL